MKNLMKLLEKSRKKGVGLVTVKEADLPGTMEKIILCFPGLPLLVIQKKK
ncbi:MAG: hypothetical protein ACM3WV_12420 [Bacillota bacterium]